MKNKIFIGKGFSDDFYLWLLPIIQSYAKKKNINTFVLEEKITSNIILKNKNLKSFFIENKFIYLTKPTLILAVLNSLNYIIRIFYFLLKFRKKYILDKNMNWTNNQILHGAWDQYNIESKSFKKKNFVKLIKILIYGFYKYDLGKRLKKKMVKHAFLSHSVYYERFLLASLREQNINIFCQAAANITMQKKNMDISWSDVSKKNFKYIYRKKSLVEKYWNKRVKGKGNYETANLSTRNSFSKKIYFGDYNLIFLHIFRDSPFNVIDRFRVFSDYYDWIDNTLEIIKYSKDHWVFKVHPAASRWGENQESIFHNLVYKNYKKYPKNVFLVKNDLSNLKLIQNAKKIITFGGTSHLESICLGKKPIIISESPIKKFSKSIYFKPKSKSEYKKLLLNENLKFFKLRKFEINIGKVFLYIRENINSMTKRLNLVENYRNDKNFVKNKSIKSVELKLKKNLPFLINQGKLLDITKSTNNIFK